MNFSLEISERIDSIFKKMAKKDKGRLRIIWKKVEEIREKPFHFKPLKNEMHGVRRVHIDSSFVLTYEVDEKNKIIRLIDFAHHDKIY